MSEEETEGVEAPSFDLNVEITQPELAEWLASVPEGELAREVENTLRAGHMVLTMVQAASGEEAMRRFFRPVTESMGDLQDTLSKLLTATKKSQRLGELGEELVNNQLSAAFPMDAFSVVSDTGHQADIHGEFAVEGGEVRKAIIEVKLYTNDVPSKELTKFRSDLKSTGTRYGLMVSLTSRLTGVSGPLLVEETEDYVAVYVPNSGLDGQGVLWGTAILRSIINYEAKTESANRIPSGAIAQAWGRLQEELKELDAIGRQVQSFVSTVRDTKHAVEASLDTLAEEALSAQLRMQHAMGRLQGRLAQELHALPSDGTPALPAPTPADEVLGFIQELGKDKRRPTFERLYALVENEPVDIAIEDGMWTFITNGRVLGTTSGTKTRLDLQISVGDSDNVELSRKHETLKGDIVTVTGKDPDALLDRAQHWLNLN
jgi:hypothetical protein